MKINKSNAMTVPDGRYPIQGPLFLLVRRGGQSRTFFLRYTFAGKRYDFSIGSPKNKSVTQAKKEATQYLSLLAKGVNPKTYRKELQAKQKKWDCPTFSEYWERIADRVFELKHFKNPESEVNWRHAVKCHAIPAIGNIPLNEIKTADIAALFEPIWSNITPRCVLLRGCLEFIFSFAIRDGLMDVNPAVWRGNLQLYLPSVKRVHKVEHRPCLTVEQTKKVILALLSDKITPSRLCCIFYMLTAVRRDEFRLLKWDEIDEGTATATVPVERMKTGKIDFRVPLSDQCLYILENLPPISEYVFTSTFKGITAPFSKNSIRTILIRICDEHGYSATLHGFRSTFRDWCAENSIDRVVAEKCLSHSIGTEVEQEYQRSDLLEQRRVVMQKWADEILPMDTLKKYLPLKPKIPATSNR